MKAGNPKKYEGLEMPEATKWLLDNEPKLFRSFCNGVGSTTNRFNRFLWHLTPNTIWGMDVTPASDLHDVGYSFPCVFDDKEAALQYKSQIDMEFLSNMMILIERRYEKNPRSALSIFLRVMRQRRASKYYIAVSNFGVDSFFKDKIIFNHLED